jgi:hypothetical protein
LNGIISDTKLQINEDPAITKSLSALYLSANSRFFAFSAGWTAFVQPSLLGCQHEKNKKFQVSSFKFSVGMLAEQAAALAGIEPIFWATSFSS